MLLSKPVVFVFCYCSIQTTGKLIKMDIDFDKLSGRDRLHRFYRKCKFFAMNGMVNRIFRCLHDLAKNGLDDNGRPVTINVWVLCKLAAYVREALCPHLKEFCSSSITRWDMMYSIVLLQCVFPSNFDFTWARLCRTLLVNDLNKTPPYDGSMGQVSFIFSSIKEAIDLVAKNDPVALQKKLDSHANSYPISQARDELQWTLLHHAAFHSSTDCMVVLVAEGLSPNVLDSNSRYDNFSLLGYLK